jgi:predicted O-methyltransferase YrrM
MARARSTRRARRARSTAAQRMLALMDRATTLWTIPVVGRAKGRLIRRLIERHGCTRAVEIGSLLGYSAILIAGAMPPRGRLTCLESNEFLAFLVKANVQAAGLGGRVRVIASDALRAIPMLPGRFDFALIDAEKADYLDYLRQLEPKLSPGAVVVADNTGIARREVAPYLEHVRAPGGRYHSRHYPFDDDAMEVSIVRGAGPV